MSFKRFMETVVFFDIDNTLINGQTQRILAFYLWRHKQVKFLFLLKLYLWFIFYKLGIVSDVTQVMKKAYRLARGIKVTVLEEMLQDLVSKEIEPKIFSQALKEIKEHQSRGHKVGIISSSIAPLIKILEKRLNLSFSLATHLEERGGFYTGKIEGDVIYGEEKLKVAKAFLAKTGGSLEHSYAFADHYSDLPLLEAVSHPIAINPDRILFQKAQSYHWPIFKWN